MNDSSEAIKRVAEEGLEARNLVNWISDGSPTEDKVCSKPPSSPRLQANSSKTSVKDASKDIDCQLLTKAKRRGALSRPKSRLRSSSAGRNPEKDLRARYWTFLFENLHRAVDEIYQTCEMDESIVESKEAIMMLENYSKDFHSLIQYININKNYEKTAPINRPTSLAWEVRKASPGKSWLKNVFIEKLTAGNSRAKRILCFDKPCEFEGNSLVETKDMKSDSIPPVINESKENSCEKEIVPACTSYSSECLNVKDCAISVAVVQEMKDVFPCNEGLVVSEVQCSSKESSVTSPSIIVGNELEHDNNNVDAQNVNISTNESESEMKKTPSTDTKSQTIDDIQNSDKKTLDENSTEINTKISEKSVISNDFVVKEPSVNVSDKENDESVKCNGISNQKSVNENIKITMSSVKNIADTDPISKIALSHEIKATNGPISNQSAPSNLAQRKAPVKRKVLVKKVSKSSCDKLSPESPGSESLSMEENISIKNERNIANSISTKLLDREKMTSKANIKAPESSSAKKDIESILTPPKLNGSITSSKSIGKANSEKSAVTPYPKTPVIPCGKTSALKRSPTVKKPSAKVDSCSSSESRRPVKSYSKVSAIQRNISYVSSLSSRNQQEKASCEEKKKTGQTISHAVRLPHHKSGSLSSLHKITPARKWGDKASSADQIPEILKTNADDDSDGWETVRGRNRCRNSPAKKVPFSCERNDKVLDLAKLNQSRFGGFPYTTKNNAKASQNSSTPKKDVKNSNKAKQAKIENDNQSSSSHVDLQNDYSEILPDVKSLSKEENKKVGLTEIKKNGTNTIKSEDIDSKTKSALSDYNLIIPSDICHKIYCKSFSLNILKKSSSFPNLNDFCKSAFLCRNKSLSDQSLVIKKKSGKFKYGRSSVEKIFSCIRKKGRKHPKSEFLSEKNDLNTSLYESDTGLTSDDQDGQTSHDEAFDAECQDLYDTAWKYKILEQQVHKLELSWGEQMDRFDMELRTPGRALEMHEKLSSPFRKKSLMESIRLQEEKQVKAREQRERLLEEKLQKIKEIEKKRQEMRTLLEQRQEKQRVLMEQKLQRAEEKRKKQLEIIIRKAHDEEEKVNEIAFINSLEAQNKRHDLISKEKDHEARLHDIQEERQRKQEEKAAKEAAAEERRKLLEAERQARLNEMQEKRKIRDHKVEQLFLVKEKERQELANQKARDREQRLSALNAQQQTSIEELQKKIQLKQEESARRHEENMEQIRQKAFELSVRRCSSNNDDAPQPVPYETKKMCSLCNVLIGSEVYLLSHLRGKKHQETVKDQYQGKDLSAEELELYNLKHIVDASTDQFDPNIAFDKERQKALKKRCKKLRQRMCNRGQEYEANLKESADNVNSNVKSKMTKIFANLKKQHEKTNDSSLVSALDKCLKEVEGVLDKVSHNKTTFRIVGGLSAVIEIFKFVSSFQIEKTMFVHKKLINNLTVIAETSVDKCNENCLYLLYSNKIGCLLDLLIQRLNMVIPNNNQVIVQTSKSSALNLQVDTTAGKLMHFLSKIILNLADKSAQFAPNSDETNCEKENQSSEFQFRVQDVISYTVSIGIVDKLSQYFNITQGLICNEEEVVNYLLHCIAFLTSIVKLYFNCFVLNTNSKTDDSTQLIAAIKVTSMIGTVSLLYGLLLHSGATSRGEIPPPQLPKQVESLASSTLCMINNIAVMNLQAFQTVLGSEDLSLQLRHITSHLLWYCNHWPSDDLLHEVILLVGYFTVLNADNQLLIQAGQSPTVLQQLCSLPFLYFSDSELTDILFPTLIACCYKNPSNKTILEQEMSSELLSNYIEVKYLNTEDSSWKTKNTVSEKRWLFSTRFPKNCWTPAKNYFAVK